VIRQIARFGSVGLFATIVHMAIGIGLIQIGWEPWIANAAAFAVAFGVSFVGHFSFTFSGHTTSLVSSLTRFSLVATGGFALNEFVLLALLATGSVPPSPALVFSTALAAASTYVLCRKWVFTS